MAFIVDGMRLELEGEANDYVGKGMSGGTIAIRPPATAPFDTPQTIAGNTNLYGATGGQLFAAGRVGERFGVRLVSAQFRKDGSRPEGRREAGQARRDGAGVDGARSQGDRLLNRLDFVLTDRGRAVVMLAGLTHDAMNGSFMALSGCDGKR